MTQHTLAEAPVSLRLTDEHIERVDALARKAGSRRSAVLRWAVTMGLEALEHISAPETLAALIKRGPTMRPTEETRHDADR